MIFRSQDNKPVEVNFGNFLCILRGSNLGLTPVKLRDGTEVWLKATEKEILEAVKESG